MESTVLCSYCGKEIKGIPSLEYNFPKKDGSSEHKQACAACNKLFGNFVFKRILDRMAKEDV